MRGEFSAQLLASKLRSSIRMDDVTVCMPAYPRGDVRDFTEKNVPSAVL